MKLVERVGALASVTGQGLEAGARSELVEVVALGQMDWSPAEGAGALVCQVEVEL